MINTKPITHDIKLHSLSVKLLSKAEQIILQQFSTAFQLFHPRKSRLGDMNIF